MCGARVCTRIYTCLFECGWENVGEFICLKDYLLGCKLHRKVKVNKNNKEWSMLIQDLTIHPAELWEESESTLCQEQFAEWNFSPSDTKYYGDKCQSLISCYYFIPKGFNISFSLHRVKLLCSTRLHPSSLRAVVWYPLTPETASSSNYLLEISTEVKFLSHSKKINQCLINREERYLR